MLHATQEAIRRQFLELYKHKPYDRITVKELCAQTPVARTTFYSYYQSIDDVKAAIEDALISDLSTVSEEHRDAFDTRAPAYETFGRIRTHWSDLYTLVIVQPSLSLLTKWKEAIVQHFREWNPTKTHVPNFDLVAYSTASAILGAYEFWLEHPDEMAMDDLCDLVVKEMDALNNAL